MLKKAKLYKEFITELIIHVMEEYEDKKLAMKATKRLQAMGYKNNVCIEMKEGK